MPSTSDITAVYRRHVKTVYRLCYSYLGNSADAEDATQSVFIKLVQAPRSFGSVEHEKAWLIVTASNHCKDVLKSAHRTREVPVAQHQPEPVAPEPDEDDRVLQAVLALPEAYKECVYLHYYEGYKTDEIARMLGSPPSTVRNRLRDARKLLKRSLGGERDD